ncbi:hypothetical protein ACLMJK_005010 [Lecanora helva]
MSVRRLSPTANLLRTSRLFSLPPPLPRPAPDRSAISNHDSDTATTPYPTHAAIETTQSSLSRGDWGLKRALPLKSTTKTSTPVIHIDNIDSIDHVTDFDSAADHVLTLRKWQDLDMPLSRPEKQKTASGALPHPKSVFDSQLDNTDISDRQTQSGQAKERWKYKGPWLAGKTQGEFNDYVEKKIKRLKSDFTHYLGQHLLQKKAATLRQQAVDKGEDLGDRALSEIKVSEEEIDHYVRRLRDNEQDLHQLVQQYLDLPREERKKERLSSRPSQYDEMGPPTTHPSAGLSYLRTGSHIYNHPELGPQDSKAPVQGRIIVPQKTRDRMNAQALIGVAGVVGKDHRKPFFNDESVQGLNTFDPDIPGGGKIWTQPKRASIDSHGRIDLVVDRADKNALNVAMGVYSGENKPPPPAPQSPATGAENRHSEDSARSPARSDNKPFGYGLEDVGTARGTGRVTPLVGPDEKAPKLLDLLRHGGLKPRK